MFTKKHRAKPKLPFIILSISLIVFILTGLIFLSFYYTFYHNRFLPNTYIASYAVQGMTRDQTLNLLHQNILPAYSLELVNPAENTQHFQVPLSDVEFQYDVDKTVEQAESFAVTRKPLNILRSFLFPQEKNRLPLAFSINEQKLNLYIDTITSDLVVDPIYPSVSLINGQATVDRGSSGTQVDREQLKKDIDLQLKTATFAPLNIKLTQINPQIDELAASSYQANAQKLVGKKLKLEHEDITIEINDSELISMLTPNNQINQEKLTNKIKEFATLVNREPQNSVLVFEENRVKEFVPSKDGLSLNEEALATQIQHNILLLQSTEEKQIAVNIPVAATSPKITNDQVNNLGIKELLGRGTSKFKGSIPSRVHNVALATSKINGVLIKPGETLSFNKALGDVSKLTGYKEAYVIRDGKTVLGDGGGVCQVSTTLFRAALDAGLPISERRGHSYRVGYYEQDAGPGLDATVYDPTTDLKIVNDTPGHILLQTKADTKNMTLTYELYGTSDGRVATHTKPVMTAVVAPPEDLYVDDPNIPTGQIKQIEHKAWGGKSTFRYEVKRGEEVIYEKTFVTNYRPWQAVYLRGTGPAQ